MKKGKTLLIPSVVTNIPNQIGTGIKICKIIFTFESVRNITLYSQKAEKKIHHQ